MLVQRARPGSWNWIGFFTHQFLRIMTNKEIGREADAFKGSRSGVRGFVGYIYTSFWCCPDAKWGGNKLLIVSSADMDAHPSLFSQSIYTALLHNRIHVHTNMYDDDVNELWHQPLLGSSISRLPVSLIRFPPEGKINRVVTYMGSISCRWWEKENWTLSAAEEGKRSSHGCSSPKTHRRTLQLTLFPSLPSLCGSLLSRRRSNGGLSSSISREKQIERHDNNYVKSWTKNMFTFADSPTQVARNILPRMSEPHCVLQLNVHST